MPPSNITLCDMPMRRRTFLAALPAAAVAAAAPQTTEIQLHTRSRTQSGTSERLLRWNIEQTAIIICDMWDTHTCANSAQRVAAMAPRMNQAVSAARSLGITIIHAPSDTMKFYEGTAQRQRMQRAPMAASPTPIATRCPRDPDEERCFPIDDSAGGCDDAIQKTWTGPYPWTREHSAIEMAAADGVSDNGQEIYNFCKQKGINNVALMGVHTNICILNRSFGIRQMTRLGFQVVLVRDLTDSMYDPRTRPFVSHANGTELVIQHIEAKWCPTILSPDLTRRYLG